MAPEFHVPSGGPNLPHPPATICCIYPQSHDKLRLINFPPNLGPAFRVAISTSWGKGIQSEGKNDSGTCYEIKLHGLPWSPSNNSVAVETCRLTTGIMRFMLSHGWSLEPRTFMQCPRGESWFFRKKAQKTHVVMCAISFGAYDKIKVIDGSQQVCQAVRSTIDKHWYKGLQRHRVQSGAEEFKLNGYPWALNEKARASRFAMYLIHTLSGVGWTLYTSTGTGGSESSEGHSVDHWILINRNGNAEGVRWSET